MTTLGPVCVNEVSTNALLDTGSPSTIALLKFVMKVQERPKYKSLLRWKEAAKAQIELPSLELKNFRGSELDLVGQIVIQMSVPGRTVHTMIQVHKDPPVDLLVGADIQTALVIQVGENLRTSCRVDNEYAMKPLPLLDL